MDVQAIFELGSMVVKITGPLMLAMIILIYGSVYMRTHKLPDPKRAIYEYARINIAQRSHAGILVYGLVVCALFFLLGTGLIIYTKLVGG